MAKPRAQTLQQRFGFQDDDLLTPAHDQIMIDVDANLDRIISAQFFIPTWPTKTIAKWTSFFDAARQDTLIKLEKDILRLRADLAARESESDYWLQWTTQQLDAAQQKYDSFSAWEGLTTPPKKPDLEIIDSIWEHPVQSKTQYIIGFVDLQTIWTDYELTVSWKGSKHHNPNGIQVTILDNETMPIWYISDKLLTLNIEVKTTIPSVGELLRQIRMYKVHLPGRYMIISPDDRFRDQIQAQGLYFVKYLGPNHEPKFELSNSAKGEGD